MKRAVQVISSIKYKHIQSNILQTQSNMIRYERIEEKEAVLICSFSSSLMKKEAHEHTESGSMTFDLS